MAKFKMAYVLFFCVLFFIGVYGKSYKMRLVLLEKCKLPDSKMDKSVPFAYYLSARKINRETAIIRTNFTIGHKAGPVFISFRGYQVQQNAMKDLVFKLEKQSCKNPVTFQLIAAVKLKLDNDCYAMPGVYEANNINIEDFRWVFSKTIVQAGKYAYELEFSTNKGVVACIGLICDAMDVKKHE